MESIDAHIGQAIVWSVLGCLIFLVIFVLMAKFSPFSIRNEIEKDQNTALAIVMGSVILGIAHIIAAAIQG